MRCSNCRTDNPPGLKFCGNCGQALKNRCAQCGFENQPQFKFCGECGMALGAPAAAAAKKSDASPIRVAETPAAENHDGERKTVTALFADIKGSTALMEELDPEAAHAIVEPALRIMVEAVHRYGGYVARSTGDGIFALFGAPTAYEDHPQRALYAALRLQEELKRYSAGLRKAGNLPLEARVGVNSGEVVAYSVETDGKVEYRLIGHTANLAARLEALAPTGSIAISDYTHKFVEGYFQLKPLGPTKVKGMSEPVNVYEVTGLGPLRTRLQRSAGRGLTKFVGREREMEVLKHAAEQAKSGHGQIVAAMAEPGVGKSRLFFEFKVTSQSGWMVLETFSVSHGKASAYLPVIDLLHAYFRIVGDDDRRVRREKVAGRLSILDPSLENARPYLFSLLGIGEGEDPLAQMDGQVKKRRILEAIKRILLRESLNQPLMVVFEDLHWIDEQTQDLLNLLADSIGTAKLLLLVNYRPEYSHQWNSKTYYTQLRLDPLGKDSAEEMLSALLGDDKDLIPLKRLIVKKTEGTPFFMEEIVQALFEEGVLLRNGTVKLAKAMNAVKVPATVQAILAARIDRLPTKEKELLQTLAVIGREFAMSLVRQVIVGRTEDELEGMLAKLQLREFIYEQPAVGDTEYIFKHALTQEVAYNSVLIERRTQLHERIGRTLEALYAKSLDDHLSELAHHYSRANNPDKSVHYLTLAGKQAAERSAFAEAQARFQSGIESINALPESPEHDAREMELATALARVLLITKGFAAPETREAAERARVLAEKGGNLAQLVLRVYDVWRPVMVSGDYLTAGALADRILYLARRDASPTSLAFAYNAKEAVCFFRGDLLGVEEYFALQSGLFEQAGYRQSPGSIVIAFGNASRCAWLLGYAEKARARVAQLISFAEDSRNAFELAFGLSWEGFLMWYLREPRHTEVAATRMLAISEEHDLPFSRNQARILMGWARAHLGSPVEGIALIRQGLTAMTDSGDRISITDYLTRLAEVQALNGENDQALATIEEALQTNPAELVFRPNLLTCRGELRHKRGQTQRAEADFREAIALAHKMQAKAWELRATNSLARLLASQDRRDEARTMLVEIYDWFTEGLDTADLKDAKALLKELGA